MYSVNLINVPAVCFVFLIKKLCGMSVAWVGGWERSLVGTSQVCYNTAWIFIAYRCGVRVSTWDVCVCARACVCARVCAYSVCVCVCVCILSR